MNLKPIFCGFLASAIAAFAWTINGTVTNEAGAGLANVSINSFNYAGVSAKSDASGKFVLSNGESMAISGTNVQGSPSVKRDGFMLTIANPAGKSFKVSLMDALGKIQMQKEINSQNTSIDIKKFAGQKFMLLKISGNSINENYILSRGALMKAGDPLASLMFTLDGYEQTVYTMKAEVESGVKIVMKAAGSTPKSSSSSTPVIVSSSSVKSESSSSKIPEFIVNCAGKTYQAGDHKMSVNVDGKNRTFIMHVPSQYKGDKAVPLVVDYHPIGGSGQGQLSGTTYKSLTDQEGVISLYPDGTSGKSMMGAGWNVGPCCSFDDDVKFSREMIKAVEEKVCIDTKRVYATGFSMGGGMSNHVACYMSDVYAAVAPAAMDLNKTNSATCNPERPISIIMFRGTSDGVCRYQGGDSGFNDGLNFLGAEGNFKFWAEKNGCTGSPTTNKDGCQEYSSCKDGTKVVLCTKQGGGHEQGDGRIGWPFLKSFTMP